MAGGQQLPEQYTVPQYARIFHSLPHLNVSLHSVNNTFNPHSEIYLEVGSLGTNPSIPSIPSSSVPIIIPRASLSPAATMACAKSISLI